MRKILISIFVCLLLVMTGFSIVRGNSLLKVEGFLGLHEENKTLNKKIEEFSQTISTGYANAQDNLKKSVDDLLETKAEYENQAILANLNDTNYTSEMYAVDYLWTRLGNYAKDEQIDLDIGVYSSGVDNLYDLKFTLKGSYLGITNFIYDIEDNSKLGFKIDDFLMTGDSTNVTAKFTCESIYINIGKAENPKVTESTEESKENQNTTTTNTTTDSNTTTNTVDTSNTTTTTTTNETKKDNTTLGQKNALSKAKSYLTHSAFSYKGLIEQLEYEGYSEEEATYGADNVGADWNEQAAKKAKSYLESSSFSRSGLIEQLEYEGFTSEQAEYGATSVGY